MIVIADTSPLNYLVLIGEAEILKRLYGRVVIPEGVWRELQHPQTPAAVAEWIARRPAWLEVEQTTIPPDAGLRMLAEGEREATRGGACGKGGDPERGRICSTPSGLGDNGFRFP